jgi:hypothetical protein
MSGRRIYVQLTKEQAKAEMEKHYCPVCFTNNMTNQVGYFTLFDDLYCLDCEKTYNKNSTLRKSKIRDSKFRSILK